MDATEADLIARVDRSAAADGSTNRLSDVKRFYSLMDELAEDSGGPRQLSECTGKMGWPPRGIYFFLEAGEVRQESGSGLRIVRVGTHALKAGSKTKLWTRLSQHRGHASGTGNHRGSIFRLLIGSAIIEGETVSCPTWGAKRPEPGEALEAERAVERRVTAVVGKMQVLWLDLDDEPGPQSARGFIERNSIALLSNYRRSAIDSPSPGWLGRFARGELVRGSGLWNQNHVAETHDPSFLDILESRIASRSTS